MKCIKCNENGCPLTEIFTFDSALVKISVIVSSFGPALYTIDMIDDGYIQDIGIYDNDIFTAKINRMGEYTFFFSDTRIKLKTDIIDNLNNRLTMRSYKYKDDFFKIHDIIEVKKL